MLLVARHEIIRARGYGALEDAVVVVLVCYQGDPFLRFDEGRHAPNDGHPLVGSAAW